MRSLATLPTAAAKKAASPAAPQRMADIAVDASESRMSHRGRLGNMIIILAALASFLWLAVAVAAIYLVSRYLPLVDLTLTGLAGLAAGITAPLTAIWLIALIFARAAPGETRAALNRIAAAEAHFAEVTARTRLELDAIDTVLSAVTGRVENIRTSITRQTEALMETADQLEHRSAAVSMALGRDRQSVEHLLEQLRASSSAAHAELANVIDILPATEQQASAIRAVLGESAISARGQIGEIELLLGTVAARHEDIKARAETTAAELRGTLAAVDTESTAAAERFEVQTRALGNNVDAAMSRAADALEAARGGVEAQVEAVVTATGQARTILVDLASDTTKAVTERLAVMADEAGRLTSELTRHDTLSGGLVESYGRSFGVLDAKLANAAQSSITIFDQLSERLAAVLEQIHDLSSPLGATGDQAREVETAVTSLRDSIAASLVTLATTLPDSLATTSGVVDEVRTSVRALDDDMDAVSAKAGSIAAPVESGRALIAAATEALAGQRESLDATMIALTAKLMSAHKLIGEVEQGTEAAALAATTKLLEALVRARDVAAQAEGAMREALDRAITDSRTALAAAADDTMRTTFTAPVTRQLAELTLASESSADAARLAADRLSKQLFAVLETATLVESRIGETDTKLETASRQDIARRGALLIDALNSSSIDIAKALAIDVSDSSWTAYLRGDRSIFTRRSVKLLDGSTARAIARNYETDGEFRDSVRRYINDFEQLMRSVAREREGGSLQITLLSSDTGKLYVALAQAMERIRS